MARKAKEEVDKLVFERQELELGKKYIAGMDEVGRGPLAGPVCVACVIMPLDDLIDGIDDSKKVSEKKREVLAEQIKEKAIAYSVCMVDEQTIDKINILEATKLCMKQAIEKMSVKPDVVLVDAISKLVTTLETGAVDDYVNQMNYQKQLENANKEAISKMNTNVTNTSNVSNNALNKIFTREDVKNMTTDEFLANEEQIMAQLREEMKNRKK